MFTPRIQISRNLPAMLLLASLLALSGCGGDGANDAADASAAADTGSTDAPKKDAAPKVPVEIAVAERQQISASYSGTASLEAPGEAQAVAKTSGVLLEVLAEEGDQVKAGQVLARIDPEKTRLEMQRHQAMLRKLEADYARSVELFERQLLAKEAHERLRYDVATQRAAYELAQLELSYTKVVAPIDGVIAQRKVKQGNLVQANQEMFRIVDVSRLEAVLNVPERELATLKAGQSVSLRADAAPGVSFVGQIARVSPVIDPASGTFRVTCEFTDDSATLKPGMFGRIDVVYDQRANALAIPRTALIEGEGAAAVFVIRDGKAQRVAVELGHVTGSLAEIRGGLEEGDQVVTTGKVTLRDGALVQVLNPPFAPEAAAAVAQGGTGADAAGQH